MSSYEGEPRNPEEYIVYTQKGIGVHRHVSQMVRATGLSSEIIQRSLKSLESKGAIIIVPSADQNGPSTIVLL